MMPSCMSVVIPSVRIYCQCKYLETQNFSSSADSLYMQPLYINRILFVCIFSIIKFAICIPCITMQDNYPYANDLSPLYIMTMSTTTSNSFLGPKYGYGKIFGSQKAVSNNELL